MVDGRPSRLHLTCVLILASASQSVLVCSFSPDWQSQLLARTIKAAQQQMVNNGLARTINAAQVQMVNKGDFSSPSSQRLQQQESPAVPLNSSPFPVMPSRTFIDLAQNQFELLATSITHPAVTPPSSASSAPSASSQQSKIKSIALYLPQENAQTGALEFVPTALYPCPTTERMFIASEVGSGLPPTMPKTLAALPGFTHAQSLLPAYPFASSSGSTGSADAAVGAVEEVFCDISSGGRGGGSALSVPLYSGSRTVGVILVWPSDPPSSLSSSSSPDEDTAMTSSTTWTESDKEQIVLAARSVAMALSMDADREEMRMRNEGVRQALENNLHQIKNPLQAMRTYSKVLQRHIALDEEELEGIDGFGKMGSGRSNQSPTARLLALAENMMVQSERVVDLLAPMDGIVDALEDTEVGVPLLGPAPPPQDPPGALVFSTAGREPAARDEMLPKGSKRKRKTKELKKRNADEDSTAIVDQLSTPSTAPQANKLAPSSVGSLGEMELEMSFVPDVLEPIISGSKAIAEERGIKFEVEGMGDDAELPGVNICPKYLQEAVGNLLDNAIKYVVLGKGNGRGVNVPENPNPLIRVSLVPNREPYKAGVTILVQDNGPGIPPDEKEAVFMRGYRGDATRLVPGSGIGLDISKSMITQMGGILDIAEGDDGTGRALLDGTAMRIVVFRESKL